METLQLLRDVTMGNVTVEESDGVFEFSNGEKLKGDTKTIYKRKNQQQYYNLNELYHYIKVAYIDKKTSQYVKSCREKKFIPVPILQRKNMLNFFTGKSETAPGIDADTSTSSATKPKAGSQTTAKGQASHGVSSSEKPISTIENVDLQSIFEGEVKNKHSSHLSAGIGNFKIVLKLCDMAEALDRKKNREHVSRKRKSLVGRDSNDGVNGSNQSTKRSKTHGMDIDDDNNVGTNQHKPQQSYKLDYDPKRPIIIVPTSGIFTMYNAKSFFENGTFVSPEIAKKNRKPREAIVKRKTAKGDVEYLVVDNVRNFSKNNWKRVVAVVAIGAKWQFKNWYWKTPADIFTNCAGFHFKYEQIPLNPEVKKMKLIVCEVSQHQRHRDIVASKIFWEALDKKINLDKPWYQPGNWKLTE